jgi:radical SAM superfamily enzyme YgiQ (UPF0313 family)
LNYLDYRDPSSAAVLKRPRRKLNGTGKFYRQPVSAPQVLRSVKRRYSRYGILREAALAYLQTLKNEPPQLVLVSTGMTYWYPGVQETVQDIRSMLPRVPIVAGGIYATLCEEHCRSVTGTDFCLAGDAYPRLVDILKQSSLPVPPGQPDEDVLILPEVFSDAAVIRLNRGCPFRCDYCASHALTGGFHRGDPVRLFELVERIHESLKTRVFAFYDDALLVDKEEALYPFLDRIAKSGMDLSFFLPNAIHLSRIDRGCAAKMREAGFREVRVGFESASSQFHRSRDGKLEVEMLGRAMEAFRAAGWDAAQIILYLLAGLPGQKWEEVEASIRFSASFGVRVQLAEYSPVPYTRLWKQSIAASRFPLQEEPLTHNNSIFPLEWEGFSLPDLERLKGLSRTLSQRRFP